MKPAMRTLSMNILVIVLLATFENRVVYAPLKYPLPDQCKYKLICDFTSQPGDSLEPSDIKNYSYLKVLRDLQQNSTIIDKYLLGFGSSPYLLPVRKIYARGLVFFRHGDSIKT